MINEMRRFGNTNISNIIADILAIAPKETGSYERNG
jgi:hypothetical protein